MSTTTRPARSAVSPRNGALDHAQGTMVAPGTVRDELAMTRRPPDDEPSGKSPLGHRRSAFIATLVLVALSVTGVTVGLRSGSPRANDEFVYFTVREMDLPITITERGSLDSQSNLEILCEVDDVPGDGIHGTPILWLVENGSLVNKGDLLIELDASSHLDRVDQQVLDTDKARAQAIRARINHQNRISRNQAAIDQAELDLELARLALLQYEDEQGGTYQIELQEIELSIQEAEARVEIDETNLKGVKELFELGYKSKGDLDQARLRALRARNALKRERAKRKELVNYRYNRRKMVLQGDLDSLERARIQVERDNRALLRQAEAWKDSAEESLKREEERLARYREQLEKCKIHAPRSGMVAYAVQSRGWGASSTIAEGVAVRDRQVLMTLPDLSRMQVQTSVHESVVDRVRVGMAADIRLDAFPEQRYSGTVKAVAVLPDQGGWLSSDTKVYETIVVIDQEVDQLKPGMTAVVELHVEHLENVLAVPVQALLQRGGETWCYVADGARTRRQIVTVGQTNDKFVEIRSGLTVGDHVVLNPSAIVQHDSLPQEHIAPDIKRGGEVPL